jgi:hypothetical protein
LAAVSSYSVTDFKKLKVWHKAHVMAMDVHRVAGQIRGAKHFSLRNQMIRAAQSVPTNIVEGCCFTVFFVISNLGLQTAPKFSEAERPRLN